MIKNYVKLSIAVVRFVEKSPNIPKKWVFEEIFFYQICPACPPAVSAQKLSALKFYSFWHFSHIFLGWEAKKKIYFLQGTWEFGVLKKTILVKTHIFEVKIRPNEGRQPGHTRPQQVGWWSSWSDLDLEFDLQGQGESAIKTVAGLCVKNHWSRQCTKFT